MAALSGGREDNYEGRRKKEEGRRKREKGRGKKDKNKIIPLPISGFYTHSQFPIPNSQFPITRY
ncbi:hypothetical protein QUB70_08275 [Microcoleus sp. A003_D6]|uniref:hypothetical protein n=1 Tax=Microcoleus sp. A003_D6 TaxID=3055266 RepID=UPI002FD2D13F